MANEQKRVSVKARKCGRGEVPKSNSATVPQSEELRTAELRHLPSYVLSIFHFIKFNRFQDVFEPCLLCQKIYE